MLSPLQLPTVLDARAGTVSLRRATAGDIDGVMALFADDAIGAARGDRLDPGIARLGAERLQLEGVRVAADLRSAGIGSTGYGAGSPATGRTTSLRL